MSARKARRIRSIRRDDAGVVMVTLRDQHGNELQERVEFLPRHELISVAARVGLRAPSDDGRWMSVDSEEIQAMVRQAVTGEGDLDLQAKGELDDAPKAEGQGQNSGDEDEGKGGDPLDPEPKMPEAPQPYEPEPFEFQPDDNDQLSDDDSLDEKLAKLERQVEAEKAQMAEHEKREAERKEQAEQDKADYDKQMSEYFDAHAEWEERQRERAEKAEKAEQFEGMDMDSDEQDEARQRVEQLIERRQNLTLPEDHHKELPDIIDALLVGEHVYLVGPPGTGKSFITEQAAEVLSLGWYSMSFGPQTPESRLWGHMSPDGEYVTTSWRKAVEGEANDDDVANGALFCGDEIDNGNGGVIVTMNQTLAGNKVTFPDGVVPVHPWFRAVVTANTWGTGPTAEFVGRNPLDAAFLDRFTRFEIAPDERLEARLCRKAAPTLSATEIAEWLDIVWQMRENAQKNRINVVVSLRTAMAGTRLKALGWSNRKVLDHRVLGGLPDARVAHLLEGTGV